MNWLAIDIGGANLKIADGQGFAHSCEFALWKAPERLAEQLGALLANAPPSDYLAVTMTGELADCFESKAAGVRFILLAASQAAGGRRVRVYLNDGRLVGVPAAMAQPRAAAAANWHALARFATPYAGQQTGLLIDIGSTTCDIIALLDGAPAAVGSTDTQRLASGELVYTGVRRSPVCAISNRAPYRGASCPLAQELFATALDVYLVLGDLPEDPTNAATADGRPATKSAAQARLGRMISADDGRFNGRDALAMAQAVSQNQTAQIAAGLKQVLGRLPSSPATIIVAGCGEFLARRVIQSLNLSCSETISLSCELGPAARTCAAAHALAVLAREGVPE